MLFKSGLDLRLKEFEEDCKRIQQVERRLQQKIDEATGEYEATVQGIVTSTDSRIFKRLREQQRLIEVQQQEIDQVRFEKELLQQETRRLREITHRGSSAASGRRHEQDLGPQPLPRLHATYEARTPAPQIVGTRDPVIFGGGR
eukprot:gnl/TRDRNA2_/TRDRNA2_43035_c0_seq1.p1 gnl/TRDRNA2_/TRDRNA2_43035_c0~~gnl/TRDRNA2_/TRDRNA2_43035_c0_seq1.p1  ORF type:complete len:144 (+),score=37.18 gnl/TRDRNA2_/TRDRNA2_43035_c0_seq1:2-433(+)